MAKSPFEKVRSLVERKKLFETLLNEKAEIICKGDDESLFQFHPTAIISDSLMQGYVVAVEKAPQKDVNFVGNFGAGSDKYFFKSLLKVMADEGVFHLNSEVYRLQRRSSLRLRVSSNLGVYMALTEFQGKAVYSIAQIADISAGGARIFFSDLDSPISATTNSQSLKLRPGDSFKCVLHISDNKSLELKGEVKHVQQAVHMGQILDHFGVEFTDLTPVSRNRLTSMTMDLQQKMVLED